MTVDEYFSVALTSHKLMVTFVPKRTVDATETRSNWPRSQVGFTGLVHRAYRTTSRQQIRVSAMSSRSLPLQPRCRSGTFTRLNDSAFLPKRSYVRTSGFIKEYGDKDGSIYTQ